MKAASSNRVALVSLAAGVVLGGLFLAQKSGALGIPDPNPIHYTGFLEENGVPVDGTRRIEVVLWDRENTTGQSPLCSTVATAAAVNRGRFRVPLVDACKDAVQQHANTWVEVLVDGTTLGVTRVSAVPYAVEADRARNAVELRAALAAVTTRVATVQGNSNAPQVVRVNCQSGETLLSGGCSLVGYSGGDSREIALQSSGQDGSGWVCVWGFSGLGTSVTRAYRAEARCLALPSP